MNQKGLAPILIVLSIILVIGIAGGAYYFGTKKIVNPIQPSASVPTVTSQTPQSTVNNQLSTKNYLKRQIDPTKKFFESKDFPAEVTSANEANLIGMSCSKEYFSWDESDPTYYNEQTQQSEKITNQALLNYLKIIRDNNETKIVNSILACDTEDERTIVDYRIGPCGGGCAGIPNFSFVERDSSLKLIAEILPNNEGAYYGCYPLQLTKDSTLYLSCIGEGSGSIKKLDLNTGKYSILISCTSGYGNPLVCQE